MQDLKAPLASGLAKLLPEISASLVDALLHYLSELERWNKAYNLTAVRDPVEMVPKHLLDAYTVVPYIIGARIIDVGTGAGIPGIPLALLYPEKEFVLLDTNGKKVRFLEHVIRSLGLVNVTAVQARVERHTENGGFDTVVCRAFTSLSEFVCNSGHLAAPEGRLVAMKGKRPDDELAGLPTEWRVQAADPVTVPGLEGERHIIVMRREPG